MLFFYLLLLIFRIISTVKFVIHVVVIKSTRFILFLIHNLSFMIFVFLHYLQVSTYFSIICLVIFFTSAPFSGLSPSILKNCITLFFLLHLKDFTKFQITKHLPQKSVILYQLILADKVETFRQKDHNLFLNN